ncbi:hypothetical protein YTPLAS18_20580 [Nitrospira sp.]|nr:hypothetical protein YTPLAS18_20580 [Nitrospira sp.]
MAQTLSFYVWVFWLAATANCAIAFDLITEKEATGETRPFETDSSIIGRGPRIEVKAPKSDVRTTNPFEFEIRFKSFGGAKINPESIEILYWSDPRRDLTPRLMPLYRGNVIRIPDARAPVRKHQLQISVTDSNGFRRKLIYSFEVREY